MKLYYCKIWDDGALVRDFIPAIDENDVGFMFDQVSHTIYDNNGTDVFLYPARETVVDDSVSELTYVEEGM